jgi:hypothetical protein
MSWSPVDCCPLRRPRNPEPHSIPSLRTSTSRNHSVRRNVELGSNTTDVASTSCPLSRTSSQGASRYSYVRYEFTTSCCFRVVCLRLSAFLPYIAASSAEVAGTHRLHALHSSTATPFLHPTSCRIRACRFRGRASMPRTRCMSAMERGTRSAIHSCYQICKG